MNLHAELAKERRARLAAERLLKLRQEELHAANAQLGKHANALTEEIVERREEAHDLREQTDQALQDLKLAKSEIHIAKRRLWDSIETIEDGFAVFDEQHELIVANTAYLSVFDDMPLVGPGVSYPQLVSIMLEEGIVDIGQDRPQQWRARMLERWHQPKPEPLVIRLWNGRFVKLLDRRSADGDTVSLALDITDTIRNQKKLERAKDRAQAANRAKSAFLARMSHELRTPMNGVVGMADLLKDTELNEEQALFVETIRSSGTALLELINDVLDFSKLEAAKFVLVAQEFSLRELAADLIRLFEPAVQTKPVDLHLSCDANLPDRYIADHGRIRQILTNLIGNAVKFTESGSVTTTITAGAPDENGRLPIEFRIVDTGIGIPADRVDYIFGEFNQVDDQKNRKYEGTGLGLAISRQLAELMGGTVAVESREGEGSIFTLTVPLQPAQASNAPAAVSEVHVSGGLTQNALANEAQTVAEDVVRKMRILAAEDNKTNRLVFEKLIKSLNVELQFAENGRQALDAWREFRPDLVFMDISMPEMDGKEATLRIRREEAEYHLPRTPVCALTAHALQGDEDEILSSGLDHYLTKPLKKDLIFDQVRKAMPQGVEPVFEGDHAAPAVQNSLLATTEPTVILPEQRHQAAE